MWPVVPAGEDYFPALTRAPVVTSFHINAGDITVDAGAILVKDIDEVLSAYQTLLCYVKDEEITSGGNWLMPLKVR